jgi:hypothetical protein
MSKFNEVLDTVEDENIVRNEHAKFTYTDSENDSVVHFTVRESDDLVYNGENVELGVVLTFKHANTKVTCSMDPTSIQYAVISFLDSEEFGNLGVKIVDEGFEYGNEEFPGTPDKFKDGFASFLERCVCIVESTSHEYPIERLIIDNNTQSILEFNIGELDEDMLNAARDLLFSTFEKHKSSMPKLSCIDFIMKSKTYKEECESIYEELVDIYCDMYFDIYDSGQTQAYVEKLKNTQNLNYTFVFTQDNCCSLVFGKVLGYVSEILDTDRTNNGMCAEYVVPASDQPLDLSSVLIRTLE